MQHQIDGKRLTYVSVYENLYELLQNGSFPPGSTLPSEPKLAAKLGVSRMTLRQALELLHDDGLIRRVRGKGTFVLSAHDKPMVSSLERLGHPVYKCCTVPIDDVEMEFRIEVPTEHEQSLFQRRTAIAVAADRWYRSGGKIIGYTLSMIPIETISQLNIDLNHKDQLLEMLEHGIYEAAMRSHLKIQSTGAGNFISGKYVVAEAGQIELIWELLFGGEDYAPLLCNKHYILPDYCSIEVSTSK
jgi:GntR family transcriptional regulator